jgi:hypothetical protein
MGYGSPAYSLQPNSHPGTPISADPFYYPATGPSPYLQPTSAHSTGHVKQESELSPPSTALAAQGYTLALAQHSAAEQAFYNPRYEAYTVPQQGRPWSGEAETEAVQGQILDSNQYSATNAEERGLGGPMGNHRHGEIESTRGYGEYEGSWEV